MKQIDTLESSRKRSGELLFGLQIVYEDQAISLTTAYATLEFDSHFAFDLKSGDAFGFTGLYVSCFEDTVSDDDFEIQKNPAE